MVKKMPEGVNSIRERKNREKPGELQTALTDWHLPDWLLCLRLGRHKVFGTRFIKKMKVHRDKLIIAIRAMSETKVTKHTSPCYIQPHTPV